jgi:hypothetical protein
MNALLARLDRPTLIAVILISSLVLLTFMLVFFKVPDSDVFKMLAGGLLTMAVTVTQFDFGSSSGSKDKDKASADTLKGAVEALSNNQAPSVAANPAVKAIVALFAVLFLLSFVMPAMAQTKKGAAPIMKCLPLDPRPACQNGVFAPGQPGEAAGNAAADTAAPVAGNCSFGTFAILTPQNLVQTIQNCGETFLTDTQAALASATAAKAPVAISCLTPAVELIQAGVGTPGTPEILANPNATPPTPDVPAVPGKLGGPVLLFEKYSEFVTAGGISACQAWVNTTVAATVGAAASGVGAVAGAAAAAAAILPK